MNGKWRLASAFLALAGLVAVGTAAICAETRSPAIAAPQEITIAELPPEARATIRLIRQGGPFPYQRDGIVFRNFEKRLPARETGYYREYTVPTPGEKSRGARRIVAGRGGELYYTADHYRSFARIRQRSHAVNGER